MSGFSSDGTGIMLLNSQIKKQMPELNIPDRSKKVAKIWSEMDQKQRESLRSKAQTEWICDPKRKEYKLGSSSSSVSTKTSSVFDTSVPFVQFPDQMRTRNLFIYPNLHANAERFHRIFGDEDSPSIVSNLQLMRRVLAEELSNQSSDIPLKHQDTSIDSVNKLSRLITANNSMKSRRKRLRDFAARDTDEWEGSGKSIFKKALVAVEDEIFAIRKETHPKRLQKL